MIYKIKYKDELLELNEDYMDVGFMAENFNVQTLSGESLEIKRSNKDKLMSIIISFPSLEEFIQEIETIDAFLQDIKIEINSFIIFDKDYDKQNIFNNRLKKCKIVLDTEDEFGSMYGTQIISGSLQNRLTKSLFLINKDGSIFYLDMPNDLNEDIDLHRLQIELNRAYTSYTGVGCHE